LLPAARPLLLTLLLLSQQLLPTVCTTCGSETTRYYGMLLNQLMDAGCVSRAQRWADQDDTITTHKQVWYTAFLGLQ
jgi:hypothetical protein